VNTEEDSNIGNKSHIDEHTVICHMFLAYTRDKSSVIKQTAFSTNLDHSVNGSSHTVLSPSYGNGQNSTPTKSKPLKVKPESRPGKL